MAQGNLAVQDEVSTQDSGFVTPSEPDLYKNLDPPSYNPRLFQEMAERLQPVLEQGRLAGAAIHDEDALSFHKNREAFRYALKTYLKFTGEHLYGYLLRTVKDETNHAEVRRFSKKVRRHIARLSTFLDACRTSSFNDKKDVELDFYAYVSLISQITDKERQKLQPLYKPG